MKRFEIYVNDQMAAIADLAQYDVVTVGIIRVPGAECPVLQATGMQKFADEHPKLLGMRLNRKDVVRIAFLDIQAVARRVGERSGLPDSETEEYPSIRERPQTHKPTSTCVLEVVMNGGKSMTASVSGESTIQFAVTWVKLNERCKIELGCIGNNNQLGAEMWFEWNFDIDQTVEIGIG